MLQGSHQHPTMPEVQVMYPHTTQATNSFLTEGFNHKCQSIIARFLAKAYIKHSAKVSEVPASWLFNAVNNMAALCFVHEHCHAVECLCYHVQCGFT